MAFNKDKALKEAEKLVAKGKDRDAIRLLEEVVKNDPRDLNSVNKIGAKQCYECRTPKDRAAFDPLPKDIGSRTISLPDFQPSRPCPWSRRC